MYLHSGCGGKVVKGKCLKCNKVWGTIKFYLAKDIQFKDEAAFDPEGIKKRIRQGKDISTRR